MYTGTLPPRSNRAGWAYLVEITDDDTGELIDISDATIVFDVRAEECGSPILSATTANGKVTLSDDVGYFLVSFTAADMKVLCAGTYDLGCTISNADSEPQQLIIGSLPILDGIVSK